MPTRAIRKVTHHYNKLCLLHYDCFDTKRLFYGAGKKLNALAALNELAASPANT